MRMFSRFNFSDALRRIALRCKAASPAVTLPTPLWSARGIARHLIAPLWAAPFILLAAWLGSTTASAQSVRWEPPTGQLAFNRTSELALVFEDCEPEDGARLPEVDGLVFGRPSVSSQSSMNLSFGGGSKSNSSSTYTLTFPVRAAKRATISIPAFDIKTDKGVQHVPPAQYTVGDSASVGPNSAVSEQVASARLVVPKESYWAGEVFPVTYSLNVARHLFNSLGSVLEWNPAPLVTEEWSKADPRETVLKGERRVLSTQSTRAYAKAPGSILVSPASQIVNLNVGTSGFGFFSQLAAEPRQLQTNPLVLTIKPLPAAPSGFAGAVGDFTFTSKVVPVTAAIGEPVTWTVELGGVGNWPDIAGLPQREVSNDFQIVQPKSKRTMKDGALFEGTLSEDVVLVPTRAGTYQLAPVHFTYFDPKTGTYKTVASDPVTITVAAAPVPAMPAAGANAPVQFSLNPSAPATGATSNLPAAVAPVPPERLPRDPILFPARGIVPLVDRTLIVRCVVAVVLPPLLLWLVLAAVRSRQTDPQRRRRAARKQLAATLAELRLAAPKLGEGGSSLPAQSSLLRTWQQQAAVLWSVAHAAPGAPRIASAVALQLPAASAAWARLWSEADRAQHSRDRALPADWLTRAESALQAVQVPAWPPLSMLAPRNLLPFLGDSESPRATATNGLLRAAVWLLVLFSFSALQPSAFGDESPADAYRKGDFPAAERDWQTALTAAPDDWTVRHNLGLALAQQDRWAEATAHWTGTFLVHPRAETSRWDLALGLQRSGLAPSELVEFSRGEGRYALARQASPGEWQLALVGAALLLSAALAILLLQGYGQIGTWGKPTALTASLLAVLLAAAATFSLHTYRQLAEPDAVFIWKASVLRSIPTEADTTQKTTPLSAGSIAVAGKTFLGWTHLTFSGGQAGWVRTEDLIALYR